MQIDAIILGVRRQLHMRRIVSGFASAALAAAVLAAPAAAAGGAGSGGVATGGGSGTSGSSTATTEAPTGTGTPATKPGSTPASKPSTGVTLSDERTFSRWAYVDNPGPVLAAPHLGARRMTRLRLFTEDGFSEVYLLLRSVQDSAGRVWVELRLPGRPNGQIGWVRREDLGRYHLTYKLIVVDRTRERMYLYKNGKRAWSAPVGIGKPGTPTPAGHFWIREVFKIRDPSSGYYPYAFGTADYSTLTDWPGGGIVGIHGPYFEPQGIPGRISHGCIRLHVRDDFWLARHVGVGVPVEVR